jgi:hypothetical protein
MDLGFLSYFALKLHFAQLLITPPLSRFHQRKENIYDLLWDLISFCKNFIEKYEQNRNGRCQHRCFHLSPFEKRFPPTHRPVCMVISAHFPSSKYSLLQVIVDNGNGVLVLIVP